MALKYTGRSDTLTVNGKTYARKETYDKDPDLYDGTFDKAIPGLTQDMAIHLMNQSRMHTFETVQGEDFAEKVTAPSTTTAKSGSDGLGAASEPDKK